MKNLVLLAVALTVSSFAKSYTVLDNRFNTPIESVLVVRLTDSSLVYTDSLGVFEFDEITPVQDIKKIEGNQKWVDASGRVVVKPDPLRMRAFEVSNSEVVELSSFKKVGVDFSLTRSGYDVKSVSDVDSVIFLDKQVLGDSTLMAQIYNDTYLRRIYAEKGYNDSVRTLDSLYLNSIASEPQAYRDSLSSIMDSISLLERGAVGWVKANVLNQLFDSLWVISGSEIGYSLSGDSSRYCEKNVKYGSLSEGRVTSLNDSCLVLDSIGYPRLDLGVAMKEVDVMAGNYIERQMNYVKVMQELGSDAYIGYRIFDSHGFNYATYTVGTLTISPRSPEVISTCGDNDWQVIIYFEGRNPKTKITQPENCKWITE